MSEKNMGKKIVSGMSWSYAERILAQGISLIVYIVLARLLLPEEHGIVSIVMVFITICDALVTGGMGNALVQKKSATDTDFNTICWTSLLLAAFLYLVLFFAAPPIAAFYKMPLLVPVMRVMGIRFIFSAFNSVQNAFVEKKMMFRKFFFATLIGTLISALIGIAMAYMGCGAWALVAQYLSNTIIDTFVLFLIIEWKPKFEFSFDSFKQLWGFGSKLLASTMVFTLKDNIRALIIGKQFGSSDLAYYDQGRQYPAVLVTDMVESIGKVLYPVFSGQKNDTAVLKAYVRRAVRVSSYLLTPCIIGLGAVAESFVEVFLTEKWLPCVPFLRIFCAVYITRSMGVIFQKSILAIGKSSIVLLHEVVTAVLTIILIIVAVFVFKNVELVAWSYVAVMLVGLGIYIVHMRKELNYGIKELAEDYCPPLFAALVMGIIVYGAGMIPSMPIVRLVIQIVAGVLIYLIESIIFKFESYIFLKQYLRELFARKKDASLNGEEEKDG